MTATGARATQAPAVQSRTPAARLRDFLRSPVTPYHLLLGSTALLVALGTVVVFSAGVPDALVQHDSALYTASRQMIYALLATAAFAVAMRIPVPLYRSIALPLLGVSILLLVLVLVPGLGAEFSGSRRWFSFGFVTFQPSELAKVALALWGADLLARKHRLLVIPKHLLIPLVPVAAVMFALILVQPDLGTTIATGLVLFGLLWVAGLPLRLFAGMIGFAAVAVLILGISAPYRMRRLTGFLNPWADSGDTGYQAVQSMLAIAGGGVTGTGLGSGESKWQWLPNAHTDFAFSVVAEELGIAGAALILGLFVLLIYALVRIARDTGSLFVRLFTGAVAFLFAGQALINLGAVTGLLPITGVPLPLISFGGTALIVKVGVLGMVAAMARSEPVVAQALALRRARRGPGLFTRLRLSLRRGRGDEE